jgi:hypothetical protein
MEESNRELRSRRFVLGGLEWEGEADHVGGAAVSSELVKIWSQALQSIDAFLVVNCWQGIRHIGWIRKQHRQSEFNLSIGQLLSEFHLSILRLCKKGSGADADVERTGLAAL